MFAAAKVRNMQGTTVRNMQGTTSTYCKGNNYTSKDLRPRGNFVMKSAYQSS